MRPSVWSRVYAVLLLSFCCFWHGSPLQAGATATRSSLHIGSFNIQVFGESKVNKPFIKQTLLAILSRYDIVFIQEIRDNDDKAIYRLLAELNAKSGRIYKALVSERLGRGEMKEQYAYFYDTSLVLASDSYVYPDQEDKFSREPFIARFQGLGRAFTLGGIHVAPTAVREELRALGDVHADIKQRYRDNNTFLLGDFNADCLYYKPVEGFDFFEDTPRILLSDEVDTSVAPPSCAYDRVLGFGPIQEHTSDARAFDYSKAYGYELAVAKLVSDHFPIEFSVEGKSGVEVPVNEPISHTGESPGAENPDSEISEPTPVLEVDTPEPLPVLEVPDTSPDSCGIEPYLSPGGYCLATFADSKKRVSKLCCG